MTTSNVIFPSPPVQQTIINADGTLAQAWIKWFTNVFNVAANPTKQDIDYDYEELTSGFNYQFQNNCSTLIINGSGTLSSGTCTTMSRPVDGQILRISSVVAITSLAVVGGQAQTVVGGSTSLAAGKGGAYIFIQSRSTWYPYPS